MRIRSKHGRRVISSLLAAGLASVVLLCRAQHVESSFEAPLSPTWLGPEGGGDRGGHGGGRAVSAGEHDFARTGQRAIRLEVWDDGAPEAMAWAGVMEILPCNPSRKVRVGAWIYVSSTVMPLCGDTVAQLKIEYFSDPNATQLLPTHIYLSPPFDPADHKADTWHRIEVTDRAPQSAASLKFSVVVTAQRLNGRKQALWLDDLYADVQRTTSRKGL